MSYTAEVTEVHYEDLAHNHDKYYRVYVLSDSDASDHRVVFQWGRRGSKGQSQNSVYPSRNQAENAARAKLESKERNGYQPIYHKELPGVSDDILELAGVNIFQSDTKAPNPNPVVRLSIDTDRCRRLAMSDTDDLSEAVMLRASILTQLDELRTAVVSAEGEVEFVDALLMAKVG